MIGCFAPCGLANSRSGLGRALGWTADHAILGYLPLDIVEEAGKRCFDLVARDSFGEHGAEQPGRAVESEGKVRQGGRRLPGRGRRDQNLGDDVLGPAGNAVFGIVVGDDLFEGHGFSFRVSGVDIACHPLGIMS